MASETNEDDTLSCCGSITGETYTARRRRNTCTLRKHSVEVAQTWNRRFSAFDPSSKIQEYFYDQDESVIELPNLTKPRFNKSFHRYRFLVVMMGGLSFGIMILLRFNISVAILNMVNQTALYLEDNPDKTVDDFLAEGYSPGGDFLWDNQIQQLIMSLYMFAYTLPQVFTTKLGITMGSRLATPISLSICGLSTVLIPMAAYQGWQWVVVLRLFNGIGASAVLPLMLNLIENWMPYDEMTLGLTCAQMFYAVLTMANPFIAGQLSAIHWSYAFYVPGIAALVFSLMWYIMITDRPDENWLISQQELNLICGCPASRPDECEKSEENKCPSKKQPASKAKQQEAPSSQKAEKTTGNFKQVFGLICFYAYMIMWCTYCSTYNSFSFVLPNYLRQFLKISISEIGIFCTIIQSGCIVSVLWPHATIEFFKARFGLSETVARRCAYLIVCLMVSGTWAYVGLFHESQLLLLFLNRCFQSSTDIVVTGAIMNNFAKANLSGLVFSVVNTVGNLSVAVSAPLVGKILDATGQSRAGWSWIFSGMGVAQLLSLVLFSTLVQADAIEFVDTKKKSTTLETGKVEQLDKKRDTGSGLDLEQVKIEKHSK